MPKTKAYLLDVESMRFKGKPAVRLLLKHASTGRTFRLYDTSFKPYFYLQKPENAGRNEAEELKRRVIKIASETVGEAEAKVEEVNRKLFGRVKRFLRVSLNDPAHVPKLRDAVKHLGNVFEHAIPLAIRWLIDNKTIPSTLTEVEFEGLELNNIKQVEENKEENKEKNKEENKGESKEESEEENEGGKLKVISPKDLRVLAFDIETYNPEGVPDQKQDQVLMISWHDGRESGVLSHSKKFEAPFVHVLDSEKDMIEAFSKLLEEKHVDVLATYNGDVFDIPYLTERAKRLKAKLKLGRSRSAPKTVKRGLRVVTSVPGRVHLDVYAAVAFLENVGAVSLPRLTLDKAYKAFLGKEKQNMQKLDIWRAWDKGGEELDLLAEYCKGDSVACYELAQYVLPLELGLSAVSGTTLFSASRSTTGQLVEDLLMRFAFENNEIIPNKPKSEEIADRTTQPIKGAFVKEPEPGLYENIAVLDFLSLYPTLIVSFNMDPATLECRCCEKPCQETHVSPTGTRFCKACEGLIPKMLAHVLETRHALKKRMQEVGKQLGKESEAYQELHARQWSFKILANSCYGYTVYPRARYYCRPCGESVTAWGRHYINEVMKKAEKAGFKTIYGDTDATFLQYQLGEEAKVLAFRDAVNKELPEKMELELEDFYPRGIFVAKKTVKAGAKKKYALINREGSIKIRGFELVRRDWSRVARATQRRVLEILLKEGHVEKAVEFVRSVVGDLKAGKMPLEDCVIYTQLQKKEKAYEVASPELAAFQKARKAGLQVTERSVIPFVITREGKTISEKAQHADLAKNYDAEYYVKNQVLPAVLKIIGALGYDAQSLITGVKQAKLEGF